MSSKQKSSSKSVSKSKTSKNENSSDFAWQKDTWKVAEKFFEQPKILAHNQINSYNDFIDNIIPSLIKNHNPIVIGNDFDPETERFRNRYEVEFYGQPYMSRPQINEGSGSIRQLFPNEARLRNLSYSAYMHLDVTHRYYENDVMIKEKTETQIPFKLPCMTHSKYCYLDGNDSESRKLIGECPYDQGGYFIINGSEKVIISQERPVDNKVLCFKQKEGSKFDESVEIRSTIDQRFYPVRNNWVSLTHPKDGEPNQFLRVFFPCLSNTNPVPLAVVFRAMGITTDKEICQMILEMPLSRAKDDFMQLVIPSFEETHEVITEVTEQDATGRTKRTMKKTRIKITTQDQALNYIAKHIANMNLDYLEQKLPARLNEQERVEAREIAKKEYVLDILRRDLLPHVGSDFRRKAIFLGHIANVLIRCKLGMRDYDVRDHYANKRLDLAGVKLKQLFQGSFGRLIKEIKKEVTRIMEDSSKGHLHPGLRKVIQNCNIDAPMKKALSTGDWNATKSTNLFSSTNLGIAQLLQRQSYINYVSNIRRIQTPMERAGGKITEPRKLDPTQYGYVCPNETPEGQQVGIVKNLALTCTITISSSTLPVKTALKSKKMQITPIDNMDPEQIYFQTKVFLNGEWIGCTRDARKVHQMVKRFKRDGTFSPYLGIYWDFENREISIRTDGGRYTRPIYTVQRTEDNQWVPKIELDWEEAKKMNWIDLVRNGYIEYIDPEECENCMIAITYDALTQNSVKNPEFFDYTHLEIHPSLNQGVVSQMIPFSDHNQGIRNLYQCLWKETKVLMADNTYKAIKDIKKGDNVISVNPETLEKSSVKVINQYVKKTKKKIIKLTTKSGRDLICTNDHPILTNRGWKKAGSLKSSDLVCVAPTTNPQTSKTSPQTLIMNTEIFKKKCIEMGIKEKLVDYHAKHLTEINILPLYSDSPNIDILSRVFGFTMADGCCGIYSKQPQIQLTFGSFSGGEEFMKDILTLGFSQNKLIETEGEIHGVKHHGWNAIYGNSFATLMMSLGLTKGKKTVTPTDPLPNWIKNGSKQVKREFLSGIQGGDGSKIRYGYPSPTTPAVIMLHTLSQQKCKKHLETLVDFFNDIKSLFAEFDIICKDVKVSKYHKYPDRYTVELPFDNSTEGIVRYFETIGYRYDHHKIMDSLPPFEYRKCCSYERSKIDELKKHTAILRNEGKTYKQIASALNITPTQANTYWRSKDMKSRLSNKNIGLREWLPSVETKNNCIFVPIEKIEDHENVEIADITVDNDWHSFIVESGIVVHNSSMGKQALGIHATNYNHRMDTFANVLCYPQKPLVQTRTAKFVNLDRLPHGQQCIVAVASYTGYNQEDSVLFNKASVERGKFNSLYFKTYVSEMNPHKSSNAEEEKFGKPDPERTQGMKHGENPYEHLDDDGFVKVGSFVKPNDVIIGKVVKLKDEVKSVTGRRITHNDISVQVKQGESGYVDARIPSPGSVKNFNSDNNPFCKVRTCQYRRPVIGDKLASRHAQKGTIGLILPEEDMPFTDSGLVPDIIMNPHALPSRMTVGQMLECIFGKAACLDAEVKDATPWTDFDRENIGDTLEKYGFERDGEEVMYNGFTGEMLKTTIFIGPVYYQRLKHMVQDKIHARATGRVNNLTKQSVEGRNQGGGLRLGEMERDVFISHGEAGFLKERFMESSDKFRVYVGKEQETMVVGNPDKDLFIYDGKMLNPEDVSEVQMPYAMKLLWQELTSMGIDFRIVAGEGDEHH